MGDCGCGKGGAVAALAARPTRAIDKCMTLAVLTVVAERGDSPFVLLNRHCECLLSFQHTSHSGVGLRPELYMQESPFSGKVVHCLFCVWCGVASKGSRCCVFCLYCLANHARTAGAHVVWMVCTGDAFAHSLVIIPQLFTTCHVRALNN